MRILAFVAALAIAAPTWTPQTTGVTGRLRGVSAVNARVAWASGSNGTILRTADGGSTWQSLPIPGAEKLDFRDIDAISDQVAYVLSIGEGDNSRIFKTTDGGRTWTNQFTNTDPKAFFDAMAFWDAERGIAFSDSNAGKLVILRTDNGGKAWTLVPAEGLPPALENEGAFAASGTNVATFGRDHVWIGTGAAAVSRVLRSADGGRTWTAATTPARRRSFCRHLLHRLPRRAARHRRWRRLPQGGRGDRQRGGHDRRRPHLDKGDRPLGVPICRPIHAWHPVLIDRRGSARRRSVNGRRQDMDAAAGFSRSPYLQLRETGTGRLGRRRKGRRHEADVLTHRLGVGSLRRSQSARFQPDER